MSTENTVPEEQQNLKQKEEENIKSIQPNIITRLYNHNLSFDPKRGIAGLNHLFPKFGDSEPRPISTGDKRKLGWEVENKDSILPGFWWQTTEIVWHSYAWCPSRCHKSHWLIPPEDSTAPERDIKIFFRSPEGYKLGAYSHPLNFDIGYMFMYTYNTKAFHQFFNILYTQAPACVTQEQFNNIWEDFPGPYNQVKPIAEQDPKLVLKTGIDIIPRTEEEEVISTIDYWLNPPEGYTTTLNTYQIAAESNTPSSNSNKGGPYIPSINCNYISPGKRCQIFWWHINQFYKTHGLDNCLKQELFNLFFFFIRDIYKIWRAEQGPEENRFANIQVDKTSLRQTIFWLDAIVEQTTKELQEVKRIRQGQLDNIINEENSAEDNNNINPFPVGSLTKQDLQDYIPRIVGLIKRLNKYKVEYLDNKFIDTKIVQYLSDTLIEDKEDYKLDYFPAINRVHTGPRYPYW